MPRRSILILLRWRVRPEGAKLFAGLGILPTARLPRQSLSDISTDLVAIVPQSFGKLPSQGRAALAAQCPAQKAGSTVKAAWMATASQALAWALTARGGSPRQFCVCRLEMVNCRSALSRCRPLELNGHNWRAMYHHNATSPPDAAMKCVQGGLARAPRCTKVSLNLGFAQVASGSQPAFPMMAEHGLRALLSYRTGQFDGVGRSDGGW